MVRFRTVLMSCLTLISVLALGLSMVSAQQATEMPAPKVERPLTLTYQSTPTADPTLDNGIFQLSATGDLSGDLTGTYTQNITQLCGCVTENPLSPIDNLFTIKTADGMLMGYIVGSYYQAAADSASADYVGHGQILSVSGNYADLYLADVYLNATVKLVDGNGVSDAGTLTITPG
ncbi:MAG TPA: hypothetical protein VHD90_01270 [Phototrophicaceae bacterium]|nr:hypothetical protein [Phototrophicaceae bacterium]